MSALVAAVRLLTVLPMGKRQLHERDMARSPALFPLVGIAIGGASAVTYWLVGLGLPQLVAAASAIAVGVALTGALHLDGLADTADGLFGGKTPEKRLAIMKDPRNGAYGMVAIGIALMLKLALVGSFGSNGVGWQYVLAAPVAGRFAVVFVMKVFPYVRENGVGTPFVKGSWLVVVIAAVLACSCVLIAAGVWALLAVAAALVCGLGVGRFAAAHLGGGVTGDVYGAVIEVSEIAALFGFIIIVEAGVTMGPIWE